VSPRPELVDEIANELDTWPGVSIERLSEALAVARYEQLELGLLDRDAGLVELHFSRPEHDELIEHGEAEPADPRPASNVISTAFTGRPTSPPRSSSSTAATASCAARTSPTARRIPLRPARTARRAN
jgi:hypothetical protein